MTATPNTNLFANLPITENRVILEAVLARITTINEMIKAAAIDPNIVRTYSEDLAVLNTLKVQLVEAYSNSLS